MSALLALALLAAPAAKTPSDPVAQVRTCLFDGLDAATRTTLGAGMITELDKDKTKSGTENKTADDAVNDGPAGDALAARAALCMTQHKWSDAHMTAAVGWTLMTASEPALRARTTAAKLDYDAVARTAAALSPADRALLLDGGANNSDLDNRLMTIASEQGILILANDSARAEAMGIAIGLLIMRDRYAAELAAK